MKHIKKKEKQHADMYEYSQRMHVTQHALGIAFNKRTKAPPYPYPGTDFLRAIS